MEIRSWDVGDVQNMMGIFYGATSFDGDISVWNVGNVTNMEGMFYNAVSFNQDLSGWCVSQFSTKPVGFDFGTSNWTLPQPVWGTCP